jgi:hypothetical protein
MQKYIQNPPYSVVVRVDADDLVLVQYGLSRHKIYTVIKTVLHPVELIWVEGINEAIPLNIFIRININQN